ncbi:MAG: HlyC/CorC family transporter [Tenericutes bacterium HGW-Tenericutes-3]|nr:MAG: HlyC/CorC family transporter [Tenericutes bacterium HGW-Tenericutes-3]
MTIGVLILLILLSAFFSSAEMAFSSLNQIKIKHFIINGQKKAQHTLDLSNNFEKLLTTILIGNNIVNIASASIAAVFFLKFWENYGVTISTAVMTTLVLVFGEITPKSLAKKMPEKYAIAITPFLRIFIWILTPLNYIFGLWQKLMNKVFKFEKGASITEEELLTYVSEVQSEGGINENEGELIRSVIDFDDLKVEEILTPRVQVVAVSVDEDVKKIIHKFKHTGYSRLPVFEENIDHIIGVINHKDFYNLVVLEKQPLDTIIMPPVYVTEYMKVSHLLELLRSNKAHMAIVKDEFGGTIGVVSMEDILEELVGDIWDEHDEIIEQIVKIEEDLYRVKGNADLEDLFDLLGLDDEMEFATVNGWVLDVLGRIANIGDEFSYNNLDVKVTAADTKKVLEVLIKVIQEQPEDEI